MPERLTPGSVATPLLSVVALPTLVLLSLKLIALPLKVVEPDWSVADSVAVPPYVPLPDTLEMLVFRVVTFT
jgi:hypothetical protein